MVLEFPDAILDMFRIRISHSTFRFDCIHGLIRTVAFPDQDTGSLSNTAMHTRFTVHQDRTTPFDNGQSRPNAFIKCFDWHREKWVINGWQPQ